MLWERESLGWGDRRIFHRILALWVFVVLSGVGTAGFAADDWVEQVASETKYLLRGGNRCVGPSSPNSVYVLNATSGEHMSASDERFAVNELTKALRAEGWIQVIHGSALPYESYTRDNNSHGRQQMYDLLTQLSDATITIFVAPLRRAGSVVHAEVVFLARSHDSGTARLNCAYGMNVVIPITLPSRCPDPASTTEVAICTNDVLYDIDMEINELVDQLKDVNDVRDLIRERTRIHKRCSADIVCLEEVMRGTLEALSKIDEERGKDDDQLFPSICAPAVDDLVVAHLNEYATLRSGTSYDDPIVGQAPLGSTVEYTGSRRITKPTKMRRCDDLCTSALQGGLDETGVSGLARCIRDDVFWLNVRTDKGQVGWMSAQYLDFAKSGTPQISSIDGCRVILPPHEGDLDAAKILVDLYYSDLSTHNVRCAKKRWLDPPDILEDLIRESASTRLSSAKLLRSVSDNSRALIEAEAHVEKIDGQEALWSVTLTLVASKSGWLIQKIQGYEM